VTTAEERWSVDCPTDDIVALYLSGALDERRIALFRSHLDRCDDCRALVAEAGRDGVASMKSDAEITELHSVPTACVQVGDTLGGKYRVDSILGIGGMGSVLRATHVELGRIVALKIMHAELLSAPEAARRFAQEARAAAALTSPHAARILDVDRLPSGVPYMVMEYLEGRDLHEVLREDGPLPVARLIEYVLQALDAVSEAHGRGIIHRDLKPHNLFLTRDGIVKVLDFGLAKALPESAARHDLAVDTKTTALIGTPHYMAPEQIRPTGQLSVRTDVYGLGATMYQLLTGTPPHVAPNIFALSAKILNDEPASISALRHDVPLGLEQVILRCLEKDPDDRYESVAGLGEALGAHRASFAGGVRLLPPRSPAVRHSDGHASRTPAPIALAFEDHSLREATLVMPASLAHRSHHVTGSTPPPMQVTTQVMLPAMGPPAATIPNAHAPARQRPLLPEAKPRRGALMATAFVVIAVVVLAGWMLRAVAVHR
jgi:eukaryotic-like serine/threonine-protein kinase